MFVSSVACVNGRKTKVNPNPKFVSCGTVIVVDRKFYTTLFLNSFVFCLFSLRIAKLEDEVEKLKESYELEQQQKKRKS
jgi:hypothetical protein